MIYLLGTKLPWNIAFRGYPQTDPYKYLTIIGVTGNNSFTFLGVGGTYAGKACLLGGLGTYQTVEGISVSSFSGKR